MGQEQWVSVLYVTEDKGKNGVFASITYSSSNYTRQVNECRELYSLHCGDVKKVKIDGNFVELRMEYSDRWYLFGTKVLELQAPGPLKSILYFSGFLFAYGMENTSFPSLSVFHSIAFSRQST